MIANLNRATERNVACVDLLINTFLKLGSEGSEQFVPKTYLLEIAARAIARAVLRQDADHEQAVQIVGVRSTDLIAAGPLPDSLLQAWAVRGEWWRLEDWFFDEPQSDHLMDVSGGDLPKEHQLDCGNKDYLAS